MITYPSFTPNSYFKPNGTEHLLITTPNIEHEVGAIERQFFIYNGFSSEDNVVDSVQLSLLGLEKTLSYADSL